MKKILIIVGIFFLLIFVCLCGCNDPGRDNNNGVLPDWHDYEPTNYLYLGDSITVNSIHYTFTRAYTAVRFYDRFEIFTLEINGTNTEGFSTNRYITAVIYKTEDGAKYDAVFSGNSTANFNLGPYESKKSYITCPEDELDIDFSKITEVYMTIDGAVDLILNVTSAE